MDHSVEPRRRSTEAYHLRGTVLPDGAEVDLWVADGRVLFEAVPGARTLTTSGWILPGLVDSHCHVGLGAQGAVDESVALAQALADRDAGTFLIRDAGSPVDTRWMNRRVDLPIIVRAGRHIARPKRYVRDVADECEPDAAVAAIEHQAHVSDGWIKLVGDWIDRRVGDLAPLWPDEIASAMIDRAHELGLRVTAHCFGAASVRQLVGCGIDCIEHGTGLDDHTIGIMADRQIALVPTLINIATFPAIAAAAGKYPAFAGHMLQLFQRHRAVIGSAIDAGVPVYAGTDAGGGIAHGRIADELAALAELSSPGYAVAAGSWRARGWLGHDSLTAGARADLIVCDEDPRVQVRTLRHPRLTMLAGRVLPPGRRD